MEQIFHKGQFRSATDFSIVTHCVNEEGEDVEREFVEFTVVGKNRSWRDFAELGPFLKSNDHVPLEK